jgi:signal peptidase I
MFVDEAEESPAAAKRRRKSGAFGWAVTIAVAVVATLIIRTTTAQVYSIPSGSMIPTLQVGDRVVVSKLSTDAGRGDIVVFNRPENDPKRSPTDPDVLIKRVIGLSGETVEARSGKVYIDGKELKESYLPATTLTDRLDRPIVVPEGQILVMGDNRSNSSDGRVFGPISKKLIVGRAIMRLWPLSRFGGL